MSSRVEASTYLALNHIFRKFLSHRVTTRIYFPKQNDAPALRRLHETIKRSKRATHLDKDLRIIATTSIRCFDFFRRAGLLQPFCGVPPGLPTSGIPAPSSRCKTASIACTRGACRIFCLRRRFARSPTESEAGSRSRSKMSVCSTTRVKSATVFSLMVDGSGSLPNFRQVSTVRIAGKRVPYPCRPDQANRLVGGAWTGPEPPPIAGVMQPAL
jgi:hypothetical protein